MNKLKLTNDLFESIRNHIANTPLSCCDRCNCGDYTEEQIIESLAECIVNEKEL